MSRLEGKGVAVAWRIEPADAVVGHRRDQPFELLSVDDDLVVVAERADLRRTRLGLPHLAVVLGDAYLTGGAELAVFAEHVAHRMPELERGHGERDLGRVAAKTPNAAGTGVRGMPRDDAFFQDHRLQAGARQVVDGGAAAQSAADDDDVAVAGDAHSSAANSPTVSGLIGKRMRAVPISGTGLASASAMISATVRPHMRPWHGPMPARVKDLT